MKKAILFMVVTAIVASALVALSSGHSANGERYRMDNVRIGWNQ